MGVLRANLHDESRIVSQQKVMDMMRSVLTVEPTYDDPARMLFPDLKGEIVGGEMRHIGDRRFMP
jgi:hypothetical protein